MQLAEETEGSRKVYHERGLNRTLPLRYSIRVEVIDTTCVGPLLIENFCQNF